MSLQIDSSTGQVLIPGDAINTRITLKTGDFLGLTLTDNSDIGLDFVTCQVKNHNGSDWLENVLFTGKLGGVPVAPKLLAMARGWAVSPGWM